MVFEAEGEHEENEAEPKAVPAEAVDESKLGVFKEFIETLDFEDLGRGGTERPERQ
jgi:hypothetical protein